MGIPEPVSVSLGMELEAGNAYYLRYGEEYSGLPIAEISLASVKKSMWDKRL